VVVVKNREDFVHANMVGLSYPNVGRENRVHYHKDKEMQLVRGEVSDGL